MVDGDSIANYVYDWKEGHCNRMELHDTNFQNNVAAQGVTIVNTGVVDGVMLDWWDEEEFLAKRIALLKKVHAAICDKAIIILNSNNLKVPHCSLYMPMVF